MRCTLLRRSEQGGVCVWSCLMKQRVWRRGTGREIIEGGMRQDVIRCILFTSWSLSLSGLHIIVKSHIFSVAEKSCESSVGICVELITLRRFGNTSVYIWKSGKRACSVCKPPYFSQKAHASITFLPITQCFHATAVIITEWLTYLSDSLDVGLKV